MRALRIDASPHIGPRGLGELFIRPSSAIGAEWEFIGFAYGNVPIPDQHDVRLVLTSCYALAGGWQAAATPPEEEASLLENYREATAQAMGCLDMDDVQSLVVIGPERDWLTKHICRLSGLRELEFRPFHGSIGDRAVAGLRGLANLKRLGLPCSSITDDALPSIATMSSLTGLDLSRTGVLGNRLDVLSNLPIQELNLDGVRISTTGWQHLAGFHSLRRLSWNWAMSRAQARRRLAESPDNAGCDRFMTPDSWNPAAADAELAVLAKLPDLRCISMRRAPIADEGVTTLCRIRQLTALDLTGTDVTDASSAQLAGLPDIREIALSYTKVTVKTVAELSRRESIRELVMDHTGVDDEAGPYLARMSQLESLSIRPRVIAFPPWDHTIPSETPVVTDLGYACLSSMTSLRKLDLSGAPVTDRALEYLDGHQTLRDLYVGETDVTGDGLRFMPELRCLLLGGTRLTDETLMRIRTYRRLERLSIAYTSVTDAGLASLVGLPSIHSLNLTGTRITGAGITLLREMPTLREVALQDIPLAVDDLLALATLPDLQTLRLSIGELSATDIVKLAGSDSLRTLYLSGSVSVDLIRYLEQVLAHCRVRSS